MAAADGENSKPRRGALFEGAILTAAAVAFGCITVADLLSHTVKPDSRFAIAIAKLTGRSDEAAARANGSSIDYLPTASISSQRPLPQLNPCEKKD